jgi:hypothetical protein
VSWHSKNWHWAIGLDINLPVGAYKSGEPRQSIGANYWSLEPLFAFSYMGRHRLGGVVQDHVQHQEVEQGFPSGSWCAEDGIRIG